MERCRRAPSRTTLVTPHLTPKMPPVEYHAAPRSPHEVAADLCRLWSENLGLAMTPEQKFQWLYRDAPEPSDLVFVLEAIADGHTVIVGTNGMASRRFRVAGRDARAAISCDLAVDRAHRSLLPALSLVRAVREAGTTRFDFVYGFPNAKAEGVLKRAGFRELGRARRWAKVLRHAATSIGSARARMPPPWSAWPHPIARPPSLVPASSTLGRRWQGPSTPHGSA